MTYAESAQLMSDMQFQGRVKVSALTFAAYIMNEPTSTPAHSSRVKWAQGCYANPNVVAINLQSPVVMTPEVQADGAAVSDANLQTAVEEVVNQVL
jgi:hypothetical protein